MPAYDTHTIICPTPGLIRFSLQKQRRKKGEDRCWEQRYISNTEPTVAIQFQGWTHPLMMKTTPSAPPPNLNTSGETAAALPPQSVCPPTLAASSSSEYNYLLQPVTMCRLAKQDAEMATYPRRTLPRSQPRARRRTAPVAVSPTTNQGSGFQKASTSVTIRGVIVEDT